MQKGTAKKRERKKQSYSKLFSSKKVGDFLNSKLKLFVSEDGSQFFCVSTKPKTFFWNSVVKNKVSSIINLGKFQNN